MKCIYIVFEFLCFTASHAKTVALHVYYIYFSQYTHLMCSGRRQLAAGEYMYFLWYPQGAHVLPEIKEDKHCSCARCIAEIHVWFFNKEYWWKDSKNIFDKKNAIDRMKRYYHEAHITHITCQWMGQRHLEMDLTK